MQLTVHPIIHVNISRACTGKKGHIVSSKITEENHNNTEIPVKPSTHTPLIFIHHQHPLFHLFYLCPTLSSPRAEDEDAPPLSSLLALLSTLLPGARRRQGLLQYPSASHHVAHGHGDLGRAAPAASPGSRRRRRGGCGHVERPPGRGGHVVPVAQDVGEPPGPALRPRQQRRRRHRQELTREARRGQGEGAEPSPRGGSWEQRRRRRGPRGGGGGRPRSATVEAAHPAAPQGGGAVREHGSAARAEAVAGLRGGS
jgi:hypothetical protein